MASGTPRSESGTPPMNPLLSLRASTRVILNGMDMTPKALLFDIKKLKVSKKPKEIRYFQTKKILSPEKSLSSTSVKTSSATSSSAFPAPITKSKSLDYNTVERPYTESQMQGFVLEPSDKPAAQVDAGVGPKLSISRPRIEIDVQADLKPVPTHTIKLKETPTYIVLSRPSISVERDTEEGALIVKDNELYDYNTTGHGSRRYRHNAEVQTQFTIMKTRRTLAKLILVAEKGVLASTYDLHHSVNTSGGRSSETN